MTTWHKTARICILLAVLLTAGCTTATPAVPTAVPTQDLAPMMTQVAQTVIAQITAEALANPTATAVPPTPTEVPTATAAPTLTLAPTATSTPVKSSGGGGGGNIVYPTSTSSYTDSAQIVSTVPTDGSYFAPGYDFDVIWTVKNTGKRDWTNEFYFKFLDGNWEPESKEIRYTGAVDQGDTVKLVIDYKAPLNPGRYTSNWGIVNDDGVTFARMYIVINVQ